jgi:hypothetical protein
LRISNSFDTTKEAAAYGRKKTFIAAGLSFGRLKSLKFYRPTAGYKACNMLATYGGCRKACIYGVIEQNWRSRATTTTKTTTKKQKLDPRGITALHANAGINSTRFLITDSSSPLK